MKNSIMDFSILNDIDSSTVDEDVQEEFLENDPGPEDIIDSINQFKSFQNVLNTLTHIRSNIDRFGCTKELLHLINAEGEFGNSIGMVLPYYEDDSVEIIEVPNTAEVEMILEGLLDKITDIKNKMRESLINLKARIVNFFKAYFTRLGIWNRKLDNIKKEKFHLNIDETAFENTKLKTYKLNEIKNLIKVITEDIKAPLPAISGKEYTWKYFPKSLALIGFRADLYTKDAYYLGEKLEDLKEINIVYKKDEASKVKKEKSLLVNLGWDWDTSKSFMQTVKSFLDTIKVVQKQCDKVLIDVEKYLGSIYGDYLYNTSQLNESTKRASILYGNASEYMFAFIYARQAMIRACYDIVISYYNIVKKAKPAKL